MWNKLQNVVSTSTSGEEKSQMMEKIEEKIMSLQSQLQEVRQQRETGNMPRDSSSASLPLQGRGRGRGRDRGGRGRSIRGGRGRGRIVGNKSLDLRSKVLLVSDPPTGFVQAAHQHFSRFFFFCFLSQFTLRFGQVLKISPNDHGIVVQFSTRREAELAFKKGTSHAGQIMKIDWLEEGSGHIQAGAVGGGVAEGAGGSGSTQGMVSPFFLSLLL
jgi:hypothetical protein